MSEDAEVTISYLILCHDSPDRIVRLVTRILSDDETGQVVIHFDKNSSRAKFNELKARLHGTSRCHILEHRVRCGWGQWSLVNATLKMLYISLEFKSSYYYLLSEFCYPINNLGELKRFLYNNNGAGYIESKASDWVKGGIKEDRYLYRHFFNKLKSPLLHKYSYRLQKFIGVKKKLPHDVVVKFGSQWWCLPHDIVVDIMECKEKYNKIFKNSWIPDESYFQTVASRVSGNLVGKSLTYYEFDVNGKPKIFKQVEDKMGGCFFYRKRL